MAEEVIVDSKAFAVKDLFNDKYTIDYYQRDYVWQRKQIEDLINDLQSDFSKQWNPNDDTNQYKNFNPYFMGEIVVSKQRNTNAIIDGQQRVTSLTLLMIYLRHKYGSVPRFPKKLERLIYEESSEGNTFNLDIEERKECMTALFESGKYEPKLDDSISVRNLVDRYADIDELWDEDKVNEASITTFIWWLMENVTFSRVWTNNDTFAYVIFESMNDRGLNLTPVEMLRSYLLSNIDEKQRNKSMSTFDNALEIIRKVKSTTKHKAEDEFFKHYFRSHYAESFDANSDKSDLGYIAKAFNRWLRDNDKRLGLEGSDKFISFVDEINFYAHVYFKIYDLIAQANVEQYLYLKVNSDFCFTLQVPLIMASIKYKDSDDVIQNKIQVVSRYLCKLISYEVWNQHSIAQRKFDVPIYKLCKEIRNKSVEELTEILANHPLKDFEQLNRNSPTLNSQNKRVIKILLAMINQIIAKASNEASQYFSTYYEIEHIWGDDYQQFGNECSDEAEFYTLRDNIGDLILLPKQKNISLGKLPFSEKCSTYAEDNLLAQTLTPNKYTNHNPGFKQFIEKSGLPFKGYKTFTRKSISERGQLYRAILLWNWNKKE